MSGVALDAAKRESFTQSLEKALQQALIIEETVVKRGSEISLTTMTTRVYNPTTQPNGVVTREDEIPNGGFYGNGPVATYSKSEDGTQTGEVEKESVQVQTPFLAAEATQTEPLALGNEPTAMPYRVLTANKKYVEQETRPHKRFLDYICDGLVFLQDCCTCNGIGGIGS